MIDSPPPPVHPAACPQFCCLLMMALTFPSFMLLGAPSASALTRGFGQSTGMALLVLLLLPTPFAAFLWWLTLARILLGPPGQEEHNEEVSGLPPPQLPIPSSAAPEVLIGRFRATFSHFGVCGMSSKCPLFASSGGPHGVDSPERGDIDFTLPLIVTEKEPQETIEAGIIQISVHTLPQWPRLRDPSGEPHFNTLSCPDSKQQHALTICPHFRMGPALFVTQTLKRTSISRAPTGMQTRGDKKPSLLQLNSQNGRHPGIYSAASSHLQCFPCGSQWFWSHWTGKHRLQVLAAPPRS